MRFHSALAVVASITLPAAPAVAGWSHSSDVNLPIGLSLPNLQRVAVASDGAGGAFVFWEQLREPEVDIAVVAMHVLADGTFAPSWPAHGLAIAATPGDEQSPTAIADGAGGAFVTWQTVSPEAGTDVRMTRVTAGGVIAAGWPAGGLLVAGGSGDQHAAAMMADGAGGVFVAWQDARTGQADVYAKRITSAGAVAIGWPASGLGVCRANGAQIEPKLVGDGGSGAFVVWEDHRSGDADVYAAKIHPAGYVALGWPTSGFPICAEIGEQTKPSAVADGLGGVIAVWDDLRIEGDPDVYVGRLGADPAFPPGWNASGKPVITEQGSQTGARIVHVEGGWGVLWEQDPSLYTSTPSVRMRLLTPSGAVQANQPTNGFQLSTYDRHAHSLTVMSAGSGPDVALWNETLDGFDLDLVAARFDANFGPTATAVIVSSAAGNQIGAAAVTDGSGGFLAFWNDTRTQHARIFGQWVDRWSLLGDHRPRLRSVTDVPADQGGVVRVAWDAVPLDGAAVFHYVVYREVPSPPLENAGPLAVAAEGYWEEVAITSAAGLPGYSAVVPTAGDSGAVGNPLTRFLVIAYGSLGYGPLPYWESEILTGYSVDNVPPDAPVALAGETQTSGTWLSWAAAAEADVNRWRVHRLSYEGEVPGPATQVAEVTAPGWLDPAGDGWHAVIAVDRAGNESAPAVRAPGGTVSVSDPASGLVGLAMPAPNPMRERVALRFGVARAGEVRVEVFDLAGRRVAVLVDGVRAAGVQDAAWDGRDDGGRPLANGLYLVRLRAGTMHATRRLTLVR